MSSIYAGNGRTFSILTSRTGGLTGIYIDKLKWQPYYSGTKIALSDIITKEETFEKCSILFKAKAGENFNPRNTLSISRIELKLHFVQNVEPNAGIGQKGAFSKGLKEV